MNYRLPLLALVLALTACGGNKGMVPANAGYTGSPALSRAEACPKAYKGGVPLIVTNESGLPAADLSLYFTASNPSNPAQFAYLNANGAMTVFASGNAATKFSLASCFPGSLGKSGAKFTFPLLAGGKLWIAFGNLPIPGAPNGQFTGPSGWTPGGGYNVVWDVIELSANNPGIFVNLTRVDMLGLPLTLETFPADKVPAGFHKTVGENLQKYEAILQELQNAPPYGKTLMLVKPLNVPRVINPSHIPSFPDVFNAKFAGGFLNKVAAYYQKPPKAITYGTAYKGTYCPGNWSASSDLKNFIFKQSGTTYTYPLSLFTSNYIFSDNPSPKYSANTCQYLLVKILMQELLRGVAMGATHPNVTPKTFYPKDTINSQYACVLHNNSLYNSTYAFAFDDAADQASTIVNSAPTKLVLTIGKVPRALPKPGKAQACVANY